jgi:hypothetical protein
MLLAYLTIVGPAVARIPGPPLFGLAVSLLFLALGMAYDRYSRRRIHAVYLWGGALLAISGPATQAIALPRGVSSRSDDPRPTAERCAR